MAATIVHLQPSTTAHTIRSVARRCKFTYESVRKLLRKNEINCYKKQKRNIIPSERERTRKKCCRGFRKRYQKSGIAIFSFVDKCYLTVKKYHNAQNDRCYGKCFDMISDRKKFRLLPKTPSSAMIFAGVSRKVVLPLSF
ncbi:hypothetical protein BV898_02086 [Hypsibius exemplaris]|uniref:Transposase Tc1-like domain-containing protein n=1 Tax=Hypsibius exemplaris TaxID=2072580 RepID=A0A1W0X9C0_HYPEX|nr:hypothetical protein BV898_02086 [Hypsibius exemplaris]